VPFAPYFNVYSAQLIALMAHSLWNSLLSCI